MLKKERVRFPKLFDKQAKNRQKPESEMSDAELLDHYRLSLTICKKRVNELKSRLEVSESRLDMRKVVGFRFDMTNPVFTLNRLVATCRKENLEHHVFTKSSLPEVLKAIQNEEMIEEIDISEKIKNPSFRFISEEAPTLSFEISQAIGFVLERTNKLSPTIAAMGRDKVRTNADSFAKAMYETVQTIKREERIKTYRETVDALNKHQIPTYREGGKWHIKSLQNLQSRWEKLGLTDSKNPKPE